MAVDRETLLNQLQEAPSEELRQRAIEALREGRFNLAEQMRDATDLQVHALVENLRVYQAELEIQNDELLRSQRQTQEALERFAAFFNGLPVAELVIDRNGLITEANPAAQRMFDLRNAHFHNHFFIRLLEEAERARVVGSWSGLEAGKLVELHEVHFRGGNSAAFIGDLHIATLRGMGEGDFQYICAVIDRSDAVRQRRVLAETSEQLKRSETELRKGLEESAALHAIMRQTSGARTRMDQALQGVVACIPVGCRFPRLVEAQIRLPEATFQTGHFTASPWSETARIRLADGGSGALEVIYREAPPGAAETPFLESERTFFEAAASHIAVFVDRCRDERELIESRERYRVLAQYSPDWEYWLNPDGRYVYVSPACEKITGYCAEAFMADARILDRLLTPDDLELWNKHTRERLNSLVADDACLIFRIQARDGQERYIEHVCTPVVAEDGRYLGRRGVFRDVTDRERFEADLQRSEDFLNAAGRLAKVGGWELDPLSRQLLWTRVTFALLDYPAGRGPRLSDALRHIHPKDRTRLIDASRDALTSGQPFDLEIRLKPSGPGQQRWLQVTCQPLVEQGRVLKLIGAVQDISARMHAEESLRQAARVFECTAEGVLITDSEEQVVAVNQAFCDITGYAQEEVLGRTPRILKSGRHDSHFYQAMWAELRRTGMWRGEIWNRHKNGHVYPELMTISAVLDANGELTHYVGVFSDISQIKRSEERLEHLANHDPLTGLPNRTLFQTRLEQCLQRAERYARLAALLFLDLDRFKEVNDALGHPVGDRLLQQVAEALTAEVRTVDTIARLGGDEFVVLLEDIPHARFAARFADRILGLFARPFSVDGHELFVSVSVGISIYPQDGGDLDTLLRHADIAMYEAKNSGRKTFRFFEPEMSQGAAERLRLEHDLRSALQRGELALHYQPQIELTSGRLLGVEALCRWQHPELGAIPPMTFIHLAEEIGLIDELGSWVLRQGCEQLRAWDAAGFRVPRLAVNLSVRELENARVTSLVQTLLETYQIEPARLELEVTESMIMRRTDVAIATLQALRALGVTVAVDDFGTGYSSLAYLKRLPLNRLKIDRTFVDKLTLDTNDDAIVRAIIALGRSLGLAVLAEGVENKRQADFLLTEGCQEGQGYLFSKAMPPDALQRLWQQATPPSCDH